ncbi:ferredoxin [Mycobacterium sp. E3251]|uniref:ferredoxin n=1 Tax=unclassified Mycobacterium TaxID=2642494 RepID=UPI0007FC7E99|nr:MULTISPECIES: ferredoxin [unclassified Mycobacterium]OBG93945.1 ferredoxin [Mycobacterium sp. E3251]OBI33337.1 ferredoxin [Mycobacterium sp. E2238]
MKVSVDLDTCDGNGVCMSICHEVFDVREDGLHVLQEDAPDELRQQLIGAQVSCPTQAITVKD